jgi:L-erythro-3,5-diaminohexanoate dehydrogenase
MATREGGTAIFFSMATSFSQANLATDIAGKNVHCTFGVGLAERQDDAIFRLLRTDLMLRAHFEVLVALF